MSAAAFSATYSDWRVIKGRKVVQIVFELPLEKADDAYKVLGGMPIAASEVWCGIARLAEGAKPLAAASDNEGSGTPSAKPKQAFEDLKPSQQAGILVGDRDFQRYLRDMHGSEWSDFLVDPPDAEVSAKYVVRHLCNIDSRRELDTSHPARVIWHGLVTNYRTWVRNGGRL